MPDAIGDTTPAESNPSADVEMAEGAEGQAEGQTEATGDNTELPFAGDDAIEAPPSFVSFLASPIINLSIGPAEAPTSLTAHQALLAQSPYFAEVCKSFVDDGSVSLYSSTKSRFPRLPV